MVTNADLESHAVVTGLTVLPPNDTLVMEANDKVVHQTKHRSAPSMLKTSLFGLYFGLS